MNASWRRIVLWAALSLAVAAGLAYSFWPRPVQVDLATLERGSMTVTVDEEGETRVRDIFVVSAPVAGRALRIEADAGDEVVAGETVVARIEPIDPSFLDPRSEAQARAEVEAAKAALALARAELSEADAELEFARNDLERKRKLRPRETITQRALDEAERAFKIRKAAVETARAAVEMREYELARARAQLMSPAETQAGHGSCECVTLRAPVDGVVLRVAHESEAVVAAGQPLIEIGDPRDSEIVADFLSADAVRIAPGQDVIIDEWGGDRPLEGRVRRVEPYGFTKVSALGIEEQRVNVIVDFTGPPHRRAALGHGFRVEVRVVLWRGDGVLRLPLSAAFRDGGGWAVFVEQEGRARVQPVELGHRNGLVAEVLSGLEPGDRVVLHPSNRVTPGVRIAQR